MVQPQGWECVIYRQVLPCLIEGRKTATSYYVLADEMVRRCSCRGMEGT